MNSQLRPQQPLALSLSSVVGLNAFEKDLLDRKRLAEQLTGYLDRLKVGAVLAIDAQWGEGKTWFGLNWKKHLETEAHKVIYIDAFAQDYVEDPFLLIAAEIADLLDEEEDATKNIREKAAGVMKAILPMASKVLVNFVGNVLLGSSNMGEKLDELAENVREGVAETTSKLLEKKLDDYASEKESLEHFRTALTTLAASQTKPIVIFIDELDPLQANIRCAAY